MKNSWALFWVFVVSALIAIVQFAMVVMTVGEVAWVGILMVAVLTVITVYMRRLEGPSIGLAVFSVAGLIFGGVLQFAGDEGVVLATLLSAFVMVVAGALRGILTSRGFVCLAQALMLMCGMSFGWKLTATWATILLVAWLVVRAKEAREEVEGLLRS